jgi:uncharacterized protein YndB with AHSA1/START domain
MAETLVAHVSATINAPRAKVWDAFVNSETIKRYSPATSVVSDWREGSPIVWKAELEGKSLEIRGTVLRLEPPRLLEYSHSRPLFRAPSVIPLENHRVTIELSEVGTQTRVSLIEQGNTSERELAHTEGGWRLALANLKALLEGTAA